MKIFLIIFLILLEAGCATPYQSRGLTGGYSDQQIDENTFNVEYQGNGYTRRQKVEMALLRRCAELTLEHGFDYFIIIDKDSDTKQATVTTPGTYNSTSNATIYGNGVYGTSSGTYNPGQTIHITKHGATATIKAFKGDKPADNFSAYNAHDLIKYLGENP
jgi:hypothetical protein